MVIVRELFNQCKHYPSICGQAAKMVGTLTCTFKKHVPTPMRLPFAIKEVCHGIHLQDRGRLMDINHPWEFGLGLQLRPNFPRTILAT